MRFTKTLGWLWTFAAFSVTAQTARPSPCPMAAPVLEQGGVQARWTVIGAPISVGKHFALEVQVCPLDAVLNRVDATMPEHRHGMNYRVSLSPQANGRWLAQGLMFHMPGRWELRLDVSLDGKTTKLVESIELP